MIRNLPLEERSGALIVGNFLYSSRGIRSICEDLAARLSEAGWPIITTSKYPGRIARFIDMMSTVWRQKQRYKVAQVDVYSGPAFIWAEAVCWFLRRIGKPYILSLHGGDLPSFARRYSGRVRHLLNSAAVVTTPSSYLLEHLGFFRRDIRLLPNPVDLSAYEFRLRSSPGPRLVWLRAFHGVYNPLLAAEVLAQLLPSFPNAQLLMLGPAKDKLVLHRFNNRVADLGVADHIQIAGRIPKSDVSKWLNQGDIFLNTSEIDNTPVSVIEAMACGLCVVSTSVGGISYLLENELDALLVPPNNPALMTAAICRLLSEPLLAQRLSQNGRKKVQAFDWSILLPQWEDLFASLANSQKRGRERFGT